MGRIRLPPTAAALVSPAESLALTEAPVIAGGDTVSTREKNWTARVTLVSTLVPREELTLRVLRNGTELRDVDLGKGRSMAVPDIGLKLGDNVITVAYVWNGAAGPESNTVTVTRDGSAPSVDVVSPIDGSTTSASQVTVGGRAETGSIVRVKNVTVGSAAERGDRHGRLVLGIDGAGERGQQALGHGDRHGRQRDDRDSHASLGIRRRPTSRSSCRTTRSKLANLPVALQITATLTNGTGTSDDGASVTFSLSPPGVPTSTYQGTIQSEQATWTPQVPTGASLGGGFATAKVTLPNGKFVTGTALFKVR